MVFNNHKSKKIKKGRETRQRFLKINQPNTMCGSCLDLNLNTALRKDIYEATNGTGPLTRYCMTLRNHCSFLKYSNNITLCLQSPYLLEIHRKLFLNEIILCVGFPLK